MAILSNFRPCATVLLPTPPSAERICRKYYAKTMGRPSIAPGGYFRCFLMGYFEGIGSERGIAYRVSDSLSLPEFLGLRLEEQTPDHSTLSKRPRRMNLGTHGAS